MSGSGSHRAPQSVVEYFYPPEQDGHRCGYCKSPNSNYSHGMWAHSISTTNYERLINVGWRRSGSYLYKPMNEKVCCPMYTIRNRTTVVEVSRSQRKVLKRFRKYLGDGEKHKTETDKDCKDGEGEREKVPLCEKPDHVPMSVDHDAQEIEQNVQKPAPSKEDLKPLSASSPAPPPGAGVPRKLHPLKKKPIRRERKRQKLLAKGLDPDEFFKTNERNRVKELSGYFENAPGNRLQFATKLVKVDSDEFENLFDLEHALYQKYQMHTHGDSLHECRASQFRRFLCDNPFKGSSPTSGTFHQHYYVNGNLFAVGVIDILDSCVSSVYFFYDPDYSFLSPGTLGALHEISFVNSLHASNHKMQYYYLGFYIHSCQKMRYKRKFRPCQLVCPVTHNWVDFDERVSALLDASAYSKLSLTGEQVARQDISKVLFLYNRRMVPFGAYVYRQSQRTEIQSYVDLVTSAVASNMLLYRSSSPSSSD